MGTADSASLTDRFLAAVAAELVDENSVAVALVGSHSRGTATPESDIDVTRCVTVLPEDPADRLMLTYRDGRLLGVLTTTLPALAEQLTRPETAVWAVPALRDARVLLDERGQLAALQREAAAFRWAPLQAEADRHASHRPMTSAEETHKLTHALRAGDAAKTAAMTTWLVLGLPLVVATQPGILLTNETRGPQQIQRALRTGSV